MKKINRDTLVRCLDGLTSLLTGLAGIFALVMMVHISIDVLFKYVANKPVVGTLEIASHYYMVAIVFLPIAMNDWTKESISAELVYDAMPVWLKSFCVVLLLVVAATVYGCFGWYSLVDAIKFQKMGEVAMGSVRVLVWPARYIIVAASFVAALVAVIQLYLFLTGRDRESWLNNNSPEGI